MNLTDPVRRGELCRASAVLAVLAAAVAAVAALGLGMPSASAAATLRGVAEIVVPAGGPGAGTPLSSGSSSTPFSLKLPQGAACAKDGLNGGRWHTYMVPSSEDPAGISFAGNGALVGSSMGSGGTGTFRQNLFNPQGSNVRGQAPSTGDAVIINIPAFSFVVWSPGNIPVGTYNIGIACVVLDPPARDNFWNARIEIVDAPGDPLGVSWNAVATPTSTTSSSVPPGSSTTSTPGSSTTSEQAATTSSSTTSAIDGTTSSVLSDPSVLGSGLSGGGGAGGGSLPATGAPAVVLVVAAFLMLIFGRAAVLLGRPSPVVEQSRE